MSDITRRQLLTFFGATTALGVITPRPALGHGVARAGVEVGTFGRVTPVSQPHPLPIYTDHKSFLATGIDDGQVLEPAADPSLATYTVVVSPELERYVILRWGDRVFPNPDDYVGYNHDYTAFIPLHNHGKHEGYLWVNHEYASFPFSGHSPAAPANLANQAGNFAAVIGFALPAVRDREVLGELLYNCGGSIVRIRRDWQGRFRVSDGHRHNRRVHGLSGLGINAARTDGYEAVTAWGSKPHQQGDLKALIGTGPAATDVFPNSSDGLGNRIIGTAFNCSGATTPWGTVLSAEENFQGSSLFFVGVTEDVLPDGTQTAYIPGTTGAEFGLVGEKYGWLVEIDPVGGVAKKHTALGRFRHENAAIRARKHRKLVVYMGDDRRGGHVWKYVSRDIVRDLDSKLNSRLLASGTLFVARFNPDGTGVWIPLGLDTPTNPLKPSEIASEELAALGTAQQGGRLRLPRRNGIAGETGDGGSFLLTLTNEATAHPEYAGKTLGEFYPSLGAVHVDAFHAANLAGGTPCARPEDFEINPRNRREVIMAMTDGAPGSDGYPDSRIFVVSKLSADVDETQQSGSLHKIIEDTEDGDGLTFHWERLVQAGEAGAVLGTGFANVDNLAFDEDGDLWGVTDISTEQHNGFGLGLTPTPSTINHAATGNTATLVGIFGNNMLFTIPLHGPNAGELIPVASGPIRSEMTGPTFVDDTLIISVQHPCEDVPVGDGTLLSRTIEMLKLDGTLFTQTCTVPRGSNWPGNLGGSLADGLPRPATIGIHRHPKNR